MNINDFAALLNGREYGKEITREEEKQAKELGFVVVFGYSDDGVELRGAIRDELGAWNGTTLYFDKNGLLVNECAVSDCPYFERLKETAKTIKVIWHDTLEEVGYAWTLETEIPHATFDIIEEEEKFCRGIVFDVKELKREV
jgi:hypothetical protein